jgi:L-fuculose-phosphate aldolase
MPTLPEQIALIGRRMFERRLTDMAGGNISARDGNTIHISPRYAGGKHHWQLAPQQIISGPIDSDELLQNPLFSREGKAHLEIYRTFPEAGAVIHAHPFHVQPFAAAGIPIQPVMEATEKFGTIELIEFAPAHSMDLAKNVVAGLKGKEAQIRKQAGAVLMPRHGIILAGPDLFAVVDALERIDTNAWVILAQRMLNPQGIL